MRKRIQRYFDRRKVIKSVGSFDEAGLFVAIARGEREILENLLEYGISPDACDPRGNPALCIAVAERQILSLSILLQHPVRLNQTDAEGRTALHLAIMQDDKHSFHLLMEAGADPDFCLPDGQSPLMLAAQAPTATFVRELIEAEADLSLRDHKGQTALMYAAAQQRTASLKALLDAGADPTLRDARGKKAADRADLNPRILELLQEAERRSMKEKLPPLNQKLSALLSGMMEGAITSLNESDSLAELEQKGKELINSLTSDQQLALWLGQLEEGSMQEEIRYWLTLLVEVRDILQLQQQLLQGPDWQQTEAPRNWQKQLLWLVADYRASLERETGQPYNSQQPTG